MRPPTAGVSSHARSLARARFTPTRRTRSRPAYLTVMIGEATLERAGGRAATAEHAVCRRRSPAHGRRPRRDRLPGRNRHRGRRILRSRGDLAHACAPDCGHDGSHLQRAVAPSRSASYLPPGSPDIRKHIRSVRLAWRDQPTWVRLVSAGRADWRPYSYRLVVADPFMRLDLGRRRGVGVANAHYGRWGFARNAWFWIGPHLGRGVGPRGRSPTIT